MIGSAERSALVEAESLLSMVEFVVDNFAEVQRTAPAGEGARANPTGPFKGAPWRGLQLTVAQVRERLLAVLNEPQNIVEAGPREIPAPAPVREQLAAPQLHAQPQQFAAQPLAVQPPIQEVPSPAVARAEALRAEAARAEALRAEALRAEALKAEALKAEALKVEAMRAEATRAELQQPLLSRTESARPEAFQQHIAAPVETVKPDASRAEPKKTELPRPEYARAEPTPRSGIGGTLASRIQMAPTPADLAARPRTGRTRELNPIRDDSRQSPTE